MIGKVILAGSNKCPTCGKEFDAKPPMKPNLEDKSFYGGRVGYFKDVECDCLAKYKLCIERRFNYKTSEEELKVINMIIEKEGKPLDEAAIEKLNRKREEERKVAEEKAAEVEALMAEGNSTVKRRNEAKKQKILATIVDRDKKIATLMVHTQHELQVMCKRRKIKYAVKDSKLELAETLLAYDPNMVVANPED